jgi:hypothetical protein
VNINALRDADASDPDFYAAVCAADPKATSWGGCVVYASADGGTTYASVLTLTAETTIGETTNALGTFAGGNIPDELNSVNVSLRRGSLASTTYSGLLAGVNMAVIADEILFFRDATLETDGTYTLRGFLRGRRGSEYAMAGHAAHDRFVLVNVSTMGRVAQSTADIGIEKLYKAVTSGMSLAGVTAQAFTNEGCGLKPYAPVHLGGGRDASNNATLTAVRRNRISGEWRNSVEVPMSEATEAYEWDIFTDSSHATVLRTLTSSTPSVAYSAASQTADGITPGNPIYFGVAQMSAVVGRGHMAYGSI